jgi:hypothetical protein
MRTIFDEPSAHDVSHMEATVWKGTATVCALKLQLSGHNQIVRDSREGEFAIYGPPEMVGRFRAIADAINNVFGVVTDDACERVIDPADEVA